MSRIKGKYVATVTITLEVDENRSGLLPYEEIEQTWKCGLNDWVKAVIRRDIIDDDLGKLEVTQTYCDICRVEEGVETTQPDHNADFSKKVSISCDHENDVRRP